MSFEEEFPSLKGKDAYPLKYRMPFKEHKEFKVLSDVGQDVLKNDYVEVRVYPETEIQKHCLDKKRIKEIIDKVENDFKKEVNKKAKSEDFLVNTMLVGANLYVIEQIRKELGLWGTKRITPRMFKLSWKYYNQKRG